jgi:hypothetical protein
LAGALEGAQAYELLVVLRLCRFDGVVELDDKYGTGDGMVPDTCELPYIQRKGFTSPFLSFRHVVTINEKVENRF